MSSWRGRSKSLPTLGGKVSWKRLSCLNGSFLSPFSYCGALAWLFMSGTPAAPLCAEMPVIGAVLPCIHARTCYREPLPEVRGWRKRCCCEADSGGERK